jgi:hypothetical protein
LEIDHSGRLKSTGSRVRYGLTGELVPQNPDDEPANEFDDIGFFLDRRDADAAAYDLASCYQ